MENEESNEDCRGEGVRADPLLVPPLVLDNDDEDDDVDDWSITTGVTFTWGEVERGCLSCTSILEPVDKLSSCLLLLLGVELLSCFLALDSFFEMRIFSPSSVMGLMTRMDGFVADEADDDVLVPPPPVGVFLSSTGVDDDDDDAGVLGEFFAEPPDLVDDDDDLIWALFELSGEAVSTLDESFFGFLLISLPYNY